MKTKLIICFALIVLLLSGCRSLGVQKTVNSATPSSAASSEATVKPPEPSPSLSGVTDPSPSASSDGDSASPSAAPTLSPSGAQSPSAEASTAASPTEKMAPKEDVSATLDDILKELNNLDKLYSQMDDLSESDLK